MRGLILAAGLGERLRPLTATRAKPALEFLNAPMLAFPYFWLDTLGLTDLTLNTHHLPDTIRTAAMHVAAPEVNLHFTHEPLILGAGGGIWNARFHLMGGDTFAVANGDAVVLLERPNTLNRMLEAHRERDALATLLVCPLDGVGERIPGVWSDDDGVVTGFGKAAPGPEDRCFHYASFMLLSERVWRDFPEGNSNILYDVLLPRLNEGVFAYRVDDMRWYETGNAADYLAATADVLTEWRDGSALGIAAERIVTRYAGPFDDRSNFKKLRLIADSARLPESAALSDFVVIGSDATVGENARLARCVVLPNATVADDGALNDAVQI